MFIPQLSISGYSHKQQILLSKVIDQLFNFKFCPKRFEIIKEQMHRALKNFNAEQPYQHAVYYLALILTEHAWTKQELIDAVSCMVLLKRFPPFSIINLNLSFQWLPWNGWSNIFATSWHECTSSVLCMATSTSRKPLQ